MTIMAENRNTTGTKFDISKEIDELRYVQQMYQNQYYILSQQLDELTAVYAGAANTKEILGSMQSLKGKESLIPAGSGFYATGKVSDDKNVLVPIGASYTISMSIESAKALLDKRSARYTKEIEKLTAAKRNAEKSINEISYRLNELVQHT